MLKRTVTYFNEHRVIAALVIFSLSFGIRFTLLMNYRDDITTVGEGPRIAYALITKGEFADPYVIPTGPTAHTTPFFPFLLAAIYKIFGFTFAGQFVRCLVIISGYSLLYALYPTWHQLLGFPTRQACSPESSQPWSRLSGRSKCFAPGKNPGLH